MIIIVAINVQAARHCLQSSEVMTDWRLQCTELALYVEQLLSKQHPIYVHVLVDKPAVLSPYKLQKSRKAIWGYIPYSGKLLMSSKYAKTTLKWYW